MDDMEIKDYVVLPHSTGNLTHALSSNDTPHPDGDLKNTDRTKIIDYRRLYTDRPDPIVFLSLPVNTSEGPLITMG
jgi:hypothetical protein